MREPGRHARTALVAIPLWVALAAPAWARSIVLERFDADITVGADAAVEVEERLRLRFEGSWNGIIRSIPVRYETPRGFGYTLFLDDIETRDGEGQPLRREESHNGTDREIKIWIPGAQDATRTVVLRYRARNGLRFFAGHDELYWNVTGTEWEFPIEHATARIRLPPNAGGIRAEAFTGASGSRERDATVAIEGREIRFETRSALGFHEGLTAVIGFDKGAVHEPGAVTRGWLFLRSHWPLVIPLGVFVAMLQWWRAHGRDPRRQPVSVRYEPPADLSPAELGTLVDNSPDLRDLTATLVDLAVRGHLEIEDKTESRIFGLWTDRDYAFRRKNPKNGEATLADHERCLLDALLRHGAGGVVLLSALENRFYLELPAIRDRIFESLVSRGYYTRRPDQVRRTYLIGAAVVAGLGILLGSLLAELSGETAITFAGILSAAIVAGFGWFMPARTVAGARALEEILGFEEFLSRVEKDRFERLPRTPETFEKYLPFAMALGVEGQWAGAFEDIYRKPPRWFQGGDLDGFHCRSFVGSLGRMSSRAGSVLTSAPRGSGGSGFSGGSSGGGFGGGGGRGF